MARIARAVAPGIPHHVVQRGNRRQRTFFNDSDYLSYLKTMSEWCRKFNVEIWAYCLMPNHVHLIAVPDSKEGLSSAISEAHRRYSRRVNLRENWRGHLWQGRFASFIMDERYLLTCSKYIELNPVRAGLVSLPDQWPWSSAKAHINGENDILVQVEPLQEMVKEPWEGFLRQDTEDKEIDMLRKHERSGRPLGTDKFIDRMEKCLDRKLRPNKPGPPKKDK